jgi:hypothetical protein
MANAEAQAILDSTIVATLGAIPTSLEELFERDPLELTKTDLMSVVLHLREARLNMLNEEARAKNEKTRPNYKPKKESTPKQPINLDEIEL